MTGNNWASALVIVTVAHAGEEGEDDSDNDSGNDPNNITATVSNKILRMHLS